MSAGNISDGAATSLPGKSQAWHAGGPRIHLAESSAGEEPSAKPGLGSRLLRSPPPAPPPIPAPESAPRSPHCGLTTRAFQLARSRDQRDPAQSPGPVGTRTGLPRSPLPFHAAGGGGGSPPKRLGSYSGGAPEPVTQQSRPPFPPPRLAPEPYAHSRSIVCAGGGGGVSVAWACRRGRAPRHASPFDQEVGVAAGKPPAALASQPASPCTGGRGASTTPPFPSPKLPSYHL